MLGEIFGIAKAVVNPTTIGTVVEIAKSFSSKDLDVAILGPKASGKTTLIDILKYGRVGIPSEATSGGEKVDKINASWTKDNSLKKTTLLVNKKRASFFQSIFSSEECGTDVPGDESYRSTYEDYIYNKDIVFLLFDISRYFDPDWDLKECGKRDVQALFDFVYDRRESLASGGKIYLLATHKDKLNLSDGRFFSENKILQSFRRTLKGKEYEELGEWCKLVDLTSKEILEQIKKMCEGED